jgi:hypothetical protein
LLPADVADEGGGLAAGEELAGGTAGDELAAGEGLAGVTAGDELTGSGVGEEMAESLEVDIVYGCCWPLETPLGDELAAPPELDNPTSVDDIAGSLLCTPPLSLDGVFCCVVGESGGIMMLVVGLMGDCTGEVVGKPAPSGVVDIVDAGGGGSTVADDSTALELGVGLLPVSEKTISGAYGSLTTIAA